MTELVSLSARELLSARVMRANFVLTEVKFNESAVRISLAKDARLAFSGGGRKELSSPNNVLWRWAAGGGLMILRLRDATVALIRYRDSGAPSWGGHYTLGSGLSGSVRDMLFPEELAVREAVEEFIIASPRGLLVPFFGDSMLDQVSFGAVASGLEYIRNADTLPKRFQAKRFFGAQAVFSPTAKDKELTVLGNDEPIISRGLVVLDPGTRGLDLIKIIVVELPFVLDDIAVFDGEGMNGKSFDAEVACLELDRVTLKPSDKVVRTFRSGRIIEGGGDASKQTLVLRQTLAALQ